MKFDDAARLAAAVLIVIAAWGSTAPAEAASIRFLPNEPRQYDFGDQTRLPPTFGAGEFTFELWIKPDESFPVGETDRWTIGQLTNWSEYDFRPYSHGGWWHSGNWLLDGHTRPRGFDSTDTREGTFSLQGEVDDRHRI